MQCATDEHSILFFIRNIFNQENVLTFMSIKTLL